MDKLIAIANSLFAIAQNGLTFSNDKFDIERYHQIQNIAASILADKSHFTDDKIIELFSCEKGYATPKMDVRGAVFKENKILMVRERADGLWSLPGGWIDVNESPSEAVCKEIFEESGFKTKAIKLVSVWDKNKHAHPSQLPHTFKLVFICEIIGGAKKTSIETSEVGFFAKDQLPPLSTSRILETQIARAFAHKEEMVLPTEFD